MRFNPNAFKNRPATSTPATPEPTNPAIHESINPISEAATTLSALPTNLSCEASAKQDPPIQQSTNPPPVLPPARPVALCRVNPRYNSVEIHFNRRPSDAALASLRGIWRYTSATRCWYLRHTPETLAFAQDYCDKFNGCACRVEASERRPETPAPISETVPSVSETKAAETETVSPSTPPNNLSCEASAKQDPPIQKSTNPVPVSHPVVVPQVAPLAGMAPLGLRPARKIIRFTA
jgi:hypothetical protein